MKTITVKPAIFGKKKYLQLIFQYDKEIIAVIKTLPGRVWLPDKKSWYINFEAQTVNRLVEVFSGRVCLDFELMPDPSLKTEGNKTGTEITLSPLEDVDKLRIEKLRDFMVHRRYSPNTVRTYCEIITTYLRYIKPLKADEEVKDMIIRFTNGYIMARMLSYSY